MKCKNPNCDNELKNKQKFYCSRSCHNKCRFFSEETRNKISKSHKGLKVSDNTKEKIRNALINKKRPISVCEKISKSLKGKATRPKSYVYTAEHKNKISNANKIALLGNKQTQETKNKKSISLKKTLQNKEIIKKYRIAAINHIKKYRGKLRCNVGKNEKQLLDEQEKSNNCKIERQYLINELGYCVDGYDKENNIIYEVYELAHYANEERIKKDLERQQEIEKYLKCKFIVLKDE